MPAPVPTDIKLQKASKTLSLTYPDGQTYVLSAEYLRVHSPSAEVRGHGKPILQTGKIDVGLTGLAAVGNYALKLVFDDGHDTGLYSWDYLYDLAVNQPQHWQAYLDQLQAARASRDPYVSAVKLVP